MIIVVIDVIIIFKDSPFSYIQATSEPQRFVILIHLMLVIVTIVIYVIIILSDNDKALPTSFTRL